MSVRMRFRGYGFGKFAELRDDTRGVSAVEFALLLPIMLFVFVAGTQWTEAITIKRKVTLVARTVGDLAAQDTSITDTEMASILSAGTAVVSPFPTTTLQIIVSCVNIDTNGAAKVIWSDSSPAGAAHAANSSTTLPTGMNIANSMLIWAETSYVFTPAVAFTMWSTANSGALTLNDTAYFRPRTGTHIARSGTATSCGP